MNAEVDRSLQSSELAQRLRRRLVESPGVINLRQLPTQHTQNTVSNIIQRSTLPDRVQSHYGSPGIFQPEGIAHLFQRSRTEGFSPLDAPLPSPTATSPLSGGTIQRSTRGAGDWEFSPASPTPPTAPALSSGTFRVSRQQSPAIGSAGALGAIARYPIEASPVEAGEAIPYTQGSAEGAPSGEVTGATAMSDSITTPPPSSEPSVRVRVQHPSRTNASIQRLSNPQSDHQDAPMETSSAFIQSHAPPNLPLQQVSLKSDRPMPPTANTASTEAASQAGNPIPEATPATPVASVHRQPESPSLMRVSRRLDLKASLDSPTTGALLPSVPPNPENVVPAQSVAPTPLTPMPLVIARVPVAQESAESTDTSPTLEQPQSSLPIWVPATPSPPLLLQRQPQEGFTLNSGARASATASDNSQPTVFATMPSSGTPLPQPEIVWRKPAPESAAPALPIRETSVNTTIARQVVSEPSPGVEAISATPALATPTAPETTPAGNTNNLDVQQIAQQVSRILTRQLTVERERRGMRTW
jgi:hypothetical protein